MIVKLLEKKEIAKNTVLIKLEKPKNFNFLAGQFISLKILNPKYEDYQNNQRNFSIASAPEDNYIEIAFRAREPISGFKKNILESEIGKEFEILGPFGKLILPEKTDKKIIMLAGGIGITPFRSMIRHITFKNLDFIVYLFYSNKYKNEIAFFDELENISKNYKNIKVVFTLTGEKPENWNYEIGRINVEMIEKYVDLNNSIVYIAGSNEFVLSLEEQLKNYNCEIKKELFGENV